MKSNDSSVTIIVAIAAIIFGFIGICSRKLTEYGLTPMEISLVRTTLTVLVLFAYIMYKDRSLFKVSKEHIWIFLLAGIVKFLSDVTFFIAQRDGSLAMATLMQMTAPYFVMVLSFFLFKENLTSNKLITMMTAFIGLLMVCDILNASNTGSTNAIFAGVASGNFMALYFIGCRITFDKGYKVETAMFWMFVVSMLANLPFADCGLIAEVMVEPKALGYSLALGVVMTAIPYFIINWAITKISPTAVSVITVLEAVSAAIIGQIFFGENLTPVNILGMSVVLFSIVLMNVGITRAIRKIEERVEKRIDDVKRIEQKIELKVEKGVKDVKRIEGKIEEKIGKGVEDIKNLKR